MAKEACVPTPPPFVPTYHTSIKQFQAYTSTTPSSPAFPKPNSPASSSSAKSTKARFPSSPTPNPSTDPKPPVTGPVARFARQMAGHGYIVAAPSSYHEFTGPEPLAYDVRGTDDGNRYKIEKVRPVPTRSLQPAARPRLTPDCAQKVHAYDEDAALAVTALLSLPSCNGRVGTTGMCLGGHLAFRCAFDKRVAAAVCYFATDIHSKTLGAGGDDSLERVGDIEGELVMVSLCFRRSEFVALLCLSGPQSDAGWWLID